MAEKLIAVKASTMQSVADAIRTRTAQGGGGENVPTGQIITMMGKTAPAGYLACDGGVYNIADYTALATYFAEQFEAANYFGGDGEATFAVPDLRGEFLRGAGTNSHANQGSGAAVGVHQDATRSMRAITGELTTSSTKTNIAIYTDAETNSKKWIWSEDNEDKLINDSIRVVGFTSDYILSSPGNATKYTSRPTNTSVLYCIKY